MISSKLRLSLSGWADVYRVIIWISKTSERGVTASTEQCGAILRTKRATTIPTMMKDSLIKDKIDWS
jgi:hypothetical protein